MESGSNKIGTQCVLMSLPVPSLFLWLPGISLVGALPVGKVQSFSDSQQSS